MVPAVELHRLIDFRDDWLFVAAPVESRCKQCHAEAYGRRNPAKHRAIGLDGIRSRATAGEPYVTAKSIRSLQVRAQKSDGSPSRFRQ